MMMMRMLGNDVRLIYEVLIGGLLVQLMNLLLLCRRNHTRTFLRRRVKRIIVILARTRTTIGIVMMPVAMVMMLLLVRSSLLRHILFNLLLRVIVELIFFDLLIQSGHIQTRRLTAILVLNRLGTTLYRIQLNAVLAKMLSGVQIAAHKHTLELRHTPTIHGRTAHKRNVSAQTTMSTTAIGAQQYTKCDRRPLRILFRTVKAFLVLEFTADFG
mmetsp:Transcript_25876/g.42274  ORF Transcript_25876/g.42274 Transcript_25876/m.42274 type:complete len:214 (-) Transcript_25876:154-795(-)